MSLSTYQDLKDAISDWLARDDAAVVDRIPDFIRLAEVKIPRRAKPVEMETIASTSLVSGQLYYALPDRCIELRNLYISGTPNTKLAYRTPEQLMEEEASQTGEDPNTYTIVDGQIKLGVAPTGGTLITSFWRRFSYLSDTNTTNWYLTDAPDLILFGALVQSEAFVGNDPRMPLWKTQYEEGLAEIASAEDRKRFSGGSLVVQTV